MSPKYKVRLIPGVNREASQQAFFAIFRLLLGKKALKNDVKEAILDIGFQKSVIKSRIYSSLKGCMDAGLKIPHNQDIFPPQERIKGLHINKDVEKKFEEIKRRLGYD